MIEDAAALGDARASGLVSDDNGTYCHLTANLESLALLPEADYAASVGEAGYTSEQITAAQEQAATWWVEEVLDGPVLDADRDAVTAWFTETPLLSEDWRQAYLDNWANGNDSTGSIVTFAAVLQPVPVLQRESRPRLDSVSIDITSVDALTQNDQEYVQVAGTLDAAYRGADGAEYTLSSSEVRATFAVQPDGSFSPELHGTNITRGTLSGGDITAPLPIE